MEKWHGSVEWRGPNTTGRGKTIVASKEGKRRYQRLRRAIVRDNARLLASYTPAARRAAIAVLGQLARRAGSSAGLVRELDHG
jgi:hypothetical protein